MKRRIELKNDFHGTACTVIARAINTGDGYEVRLTEPQHARASRKLCGVDGCQCGGIRGVAGFSRAYVEII